MNRREARKQAFILLFQYKFQPEDTERLLEDFFVEHNAGTQREYIDAVVRGTVTNRSEIDERLSEYAKDWSLDRISSVSLAAMRLGAYEMLFIDDIPPAVSVNEAVGIVKEYEGDEAASFVNGILGGMQKALKN
ncbi:MAG: transcription antitermination factor NusB [Monoglobaceae bacterium]